MTNIVPRDTDSDDAIEYARCILANTDADPGMPFVMPSEHVSTAHEVQYARARALYLRARSGLVGLLRLSEKVRRERSLVRAIEQATSSVGLLDEVLGFFSELFDKANAFERGEFALGYADEEKHVSLAARRAMALDLDDLIDEVSHCADQLAEFASDEDLAEHERQIEATKRALAEVARRNYERHAMRSAMCLARARGGSARATRARTSHRRVVRIAPSARATADPDGEPSAARLAIAGGVP